MKIVISAGGTGGHFFPGVEVGFELLKRGHQVCLITDKRCLKYIDKNSKVSYKVLHYQMFSNKIKNIFSLSVATLKSLYFLFRYKPQVIIGFGGYPTFPHLLASVILKIPIIIHEQNYFLGKTNRFFADYSKKIAFSYQNETIKTTDNDKYIFTGDIVRNNIKALPVKQFSNDDSFHLFIFGGSQGASIFTQIIPKAVAIVVKHLPNLKLSISQQVGDAEQANLNKIYHNLNIAYNLAEFFYDMASEYKKADLVICRSGASSIAELSAIGMPAIFVPYPLASENHQYYNAKALCDAGAGWLITQNNLTSEVLADKIIQIISDKSCLNDASKVLLHRKNDGHKIIADTVEEIIK